MLDKTVCNPYGFVYITTNLLNGKRYIGKRKFSKNWKSYLDRVSFNPTRS